MVYTRPSTVGLLLKVWFGGCNEKCTVITEKSGADWCTIGANTASISADRVL